MPTVANRHHLKGPWPIRAIYIGRPGPLANSIFELHCHVVDGTALGNRFTKKEHGDKALEFYRRWLWHQVLGRNTRVMKVLRSIRADSVLVCSCKPRPCHGDVVLAAWEWAVDEWLLFAGQA